jgi:predicted transcriptional regulator
MTDLVRITASSLRAARKLAGFTSQTALAKAAGLVRSTVAAFEQGACHTKAESVLAMRQAIEERGVEFIEGGARKRLRAAPVILTDAR